MPGCEEIIEEIPGRPYRKYCSPTHRQAARKLRLEQSYQRQEQDPEPRSPWAPPAPRTEPAAESDPPTEPVPIPPAEPEAPRIPEPTPPPADELPALAPPPFAPPPAGDVKKAASRRRRTEAAALARRRAVALLGAFGILAGGGSYVAGNQNTIPGTPEAAAPEAAPPRVDPAQWATQARDTLDSVDDQLALIERTKELWRQAPVRHNAADLPIPVRDLLARESLLKQQQAILRSQLANYQTLGTAGADLAAAQQRMSSLDQMLQALPPVAESTPEQQASRDQLLQQRATARGQVDAKQKDLAALRGGVESAARNPLRDTGADITDSAVRGVVDLTEGKDPGRGSEQDPGDNPLAIGQRPQTGGRERQDPGNAAPPNPGGARDGLVGPPAGRSGGGTGGPNLASPDTGSGVGGTVTGAVGRAVDVDDSDDDSSGRSERAGGSDDDSRGRVRHRDDSDSVTDAEKLRRVRETMRLVSQVNGSSGGDLDDAVKSIMGSQGRSHLPSRPSRSGSDTTTGPRAETGAPKTASPKTASPKTASPKAATPKAATPKAAAPKSEAQPKAGSESPSRSGARPGQARPGSRPSTGQPGQPGQPAKPSQPTKPSAGSPKKAQQGEASSPRGTGKFRTVRGESRNGSGTMNGSGSHRDRELVGAGSGSGRPSHGGGGRLRESRSGSSSDGGGRGAKFGSGSGTSGGKYTRSSSGGGKKSSASGRSGGDSGRGGSRAGRGGGGHSGAHGTSGGHGGGSGKSGGGGSRGGGGKGGGGKSKGGGKH
ncbi:hypothetical protein [Pseudonocardia acaciae]|uniref:hypothetical protein n=1 Tax=Pseudonocardia acaciae TaxID=551276 RepID=UPI00048CFAB4|nr:hypothetical protein [Pseudonocardia acaciae]